MIATLEDRLLIGCSLGDQPADSIHRSYRQHEPMQNSKLLQQTPVYSAARPILAHKTERCISGELVDNGSSIIFCKRIAWAIPKHGFAEPQTATQVKSNPVIRNGRIWSYLSSVARNVEPWLWGRCS